MCEYGSEESFIVLESYEYVSRFSEKFKLKYKFLWILIFVLKIFVIYFKYFIIYLNRDMLK